MPANTNPSVALKISTRLSISTRARLAVPPVPIQPPTPVCLLQFEKFILVPRNPVHVVTNRVVLVLMSKAADVKPARVTVWLKSKCIFCLTSTSPAIYAKANVIIAKLSIFSTRVRLSIRCWKWLLKTHPCFSARDRCWNESWIRWWMWALVL